MKVSYKIPAPFPQVLVRRLRNATSRISRTKKTLLNIAYLAETSGKVIFATQYRGIDGGTGTEEYGGFSDKAEFYVFLHFRNAHSAVFKTI